MSILARCLMFSVLLVLLSACSSESEDANSQAKTEITKTLTINPGDTYVLSGDQSGPYAVMMHNQGQADLLTTCSLSDYPRAVTLGPQGKSTRQIAAEGTATFTNSSDTEIAELTISVTSASEQAINIERNSG